MSCKAFSLAVMPILVALVVASRFHAKDWLSDRVTRRSHVRWAGILCISFLIAYASLPVMRFASAFCAYRSRILGRGIRSGCSTIRACGRELPWWRPEAREHTVPDEALVEQLIEFGKKGPLPVTLDPRSYEGHSFSRLITSLCRDMWEKGRRLDAITLLQTSAILSRCDHQGNGWI